jgi:chemotaxis protein CheD
MRRPSLLKHESVTVSTPVVSAESQDPASRNCSLLHPGQISVSADGQSIAIILGSCVAVCVWDPVNAVGGATHYMLPTWDEKGVPSPRYGSVAISILLQKLLQAGAVRGQLRAKIFGGGCLFDSMRESSANKEQHLGSRNVDIALEILAKAHIPVVSREVGGDRGQRIVFRTDTGASSTKFL